MTSSKPSKIKTLPSPPISHKNNHGSLAFVNSKIESSASTSP